MYAIRSYYGFLRHVLRQLQMGGARFLSLSDLERLANRFGNDLRFRNRGIPFGDRLKHRDDVDVLVRFLMATIQRRLPADRDQRSTIQVGIHVITSYSIHYTKLYDLR